MKRIFCFLAMLCFFFRVGAQENNINSELAGSSSPAGNTVLKPGDKIPDIPLGKILNPAKGNANRLSDFKCKLLILDFWATSCGACIQAMPRLDSLGTSFAGRLVVLPVTTETGERITAFQHTNSYLKGLKFRTVVEDKVLGTLFPHRMLPHEVWIDGNGIVIGFTEGSEVTTENINRVLAGKGLPLTNKQDALSFDRDKPLLVDGNGGTDSIYRYRSIMTGKLAGLPAGVSISYDSVKRLTVIRATNVTLRRLYTIVFKGLRALPDSAVDVAAGYPDSMNLRSAANTMFCYELDIPETAPGLVRRSVREDLDRFFGVRSEYTGTSFRLTPKTKEFIDDEPLTL